MGPSRRRNGNVAGATIALLLLACLVARSCQGAQAIADRQAVGAATGSASSAGRTDDDGAGADAATADQGRRESVSEALFRRAQDLQRRADAATIGQAFGWPIHAPVAGGTADGAAAGSSAPAPALATTSTSTNVPRDRRMAMELLIEAAGIEPATSAPKRVKQPAASSPSSSAKTTTTKTAAAAAAAAAATAPLPGFPGLRFRQGSGAEPPHPGALRELAKLVTAGRASALVKQAVSAPPGAAAAAPAAAHHHHHHQQHDLALELYRRAADLGDPEAHGAMGVRLATGLGGRGSSSSYDGDGQGGGDDGDDADQQAAAAAARAVLHYYFGALGGDAQSRLAMGYRHSQGIGVPQSCWTAVSYYAPAALAVADAASGVPGADSGAGLPGGALPQLERLRLNVHAAEGGLRTDRHREIVRYYQSNADRGDVDAQAAVGRVLSAGTHGVARDPRLAARYLGGAARAGDADAMAHLGHLAAAGLGGGGGGGAGAGGQGGALAGGGPAAGGAPDGNGDEGGGGVIAAARRRLQGLLPRRQQQQQANDDEEARGAAADGDAGGSPPLLLAALSELARALVELGGADAAAGALGLGGAAGGGGRASAAQSSSASASSSLGGHAGAAGGVADGFPDVSAALRWFRASAAKGSPLGQYGLGALHLLGSEGVVRGAASRQQQQALPSSSAGGGDGAGGRDGASAADGGKRGGAPAAADSPSRGQEAAGATGEETTTTTTKTTTTATTEQQGKKRSNNKKKRAASKARRGPTTTPAAAASGAAQILHPSPEKAVKLLQKASDAGLPDAHFALGVAHWAGVGVARRSASRAYLHFAAAAAAGHPQAQYAAAAMQLAGSGTPRACAPALALLKSLAERGHAAAALQRAHEAFFRGAYAEALLLYLSAAEAGSELGQSNAAWMLERGHGHGMFGGGRGGTAAALRLSAVLYARAARQGSPSALLALGDALYRGGGGGDGGGGDGGGGGGGRDGGFPPDPRRAAAVYYEAVHDNMHQPRGAASAGALAEAMWDVGWCHQHGQGAPRDLGLAARYYGMARAAHRDAGPAMAVALAWLRVHRYVEETLVPRWLGEAWRPAARRAVAWASGVRAGARGAGRAASGGASSAAGGGGGSAAGAAASMLADRFALLSASWSWRRQHALDLLLPPRLARAAEMLAAAVSGGGGAGGRSAHGGGAARGGGGGVDGETGLLLLLCALLWLVLRARARRRQEAAAAVGVGGGDEPPGAQEQEEQQQGGG